MRSVLGIMSEDGLGEWKVKWLWRGMMVRGVEGGVGEGIVLLFFSS